MTIGPRQTTACAGIDQKADRHRRQPVGAQRLDELAIGRARMLADQAQHHRLAGAIDVGIEDADLRAPGRPGQGQIDRNRGFANSTLAARHGDDILDAGEGLETALYGMRHGCDW